MAAPHFIHMTEAERAARLAEAKRAARVTARAARAGCDPAWGADLARHVLEQGPPPPGAVVGGFWPLPGEIDIRPLLRELHARGHELVLPETPPLGEPLRFRLWTPTTPMRRERFGTYYPEGEPRAPDWLLVPLLAFDRRGRRLGYGGGYYDRTLPLLMLRPGGLLGCAFAAQELDEVPANAYDARLPRVATERGVVVCDET